MESNDSPQPGAPSHKVGGSVEPLGLAKAPRNHPQAPESPAGTRYELRDPFAEVTYRSERMGEIAAKADQLGSVRFTSIASDGTRGSVVKTGDRWEHHATTQQRVPAAGEAASGNPPVRTLASDKPLPSYVIDPREARLSLIARIQADLADRYVIKRPVLSAVNISLGHIEYRFKGDVSRIAFTESTFRLSTETNSPSVARSMVDVAQARNWQSLRVSGAEEFRRMVWLEATTRGLKTVGYEPVPSDYALLKKTTEDRQTNRIEPTPEGSASPPSKDSGRGGGRKAVLAAIEAILVAKGVSAPRRNAVLRAAEEQLAARRKQDPGLAVKVYDVTAPASRLPPRHAPEPNRSQDRPSPSR
jgi:hypothetical protein